MAAAGFYAVNLPRTEGAPELLGLWQIVPGCFASSAAPRTRRCGGGGDALCWWVDLPRDPAGAWAALACGQDLLADSRRSLEEAGVALRAYARCGGPRSAGQVTFDLEAPPTFSSHAGRELDLLLLEATGAAQTVDLEALASAPSLSFQAPPRGSRVAGAQAGYRAFLIQLQQALSRYAQVETAVEGQLLASTRVGWTGDMATACEVRATSRQIGLHRRSVDLALETRAGMLRIAVLIVQGARLLAQVPAVLAAPPALVVVAPAAWRFLHQVLAEARRRRVAA